MFACVPAWVLAVPGLLLWLGFVPSRARWVTPGSVAAAAIALRQGRFSGAFLARAIHVAAR